MDLRQELAEAKIGLRDQQDRHATMKAIAENRAGVSGKNEDERKRATLTALTDDEAYCTELSALRDAEAQVLRIEADIASLDDARSAARLAERERHDAALERLAAAWEQLGSTPLIQATGKRVVDTEDWYQR